MTLTASQAARMVGATRDINGWEVDGVSVTESELIAMAQAMGGADAQFAQFFGQGQA